MAYLNGRLPASALAPIGGGYYLRRDAALRWWAQKDHVKAKTGHIMAVIAGYRTYARQVYFWNLYKSGKGNLAAYPGTSNHGLGIAVDLASQLDRSYVDQYGAPYGWAKKWSDAPSEWWHIKWAGFGIVTRVPTKPDDIVIQKGSKPSQAIQTLQVLLRQAGYLPKGWHAHEKYTLYVRRALRKFQKDHNLPVDGVVGPKTWATLRAAKKIQS